MYSVVAVVVVVVVRPPKKNHRAWMKMVEVKQPGIDPAMSSKPWTLQDNALRLPAPWLCGAQPRDFDFMQVKGSAAPLERALTQMFSKDRARSSDKPFFRDFSISFVLVHFFLNDRFYECRCQECNLQCPWFVDVALACCLRECSHCLGPLAGIICFWNLLLTTLNNHH